MLPFCGGSLGLGLPLCQLDMPPALKLCTPVLNSALDLTLRLYLSLASGVTLVHNTILSLTESNV